MLLGSKCQIFLVISTQGLLSFPEGIMEGKNGGKEGRTEGKIKQNNSTGPSVKVNSGSRKGA